MVKNMTGRERITTIIKGEQPDRIPFAPFIDQYYVRSLPDMGIPLESILSDKASSSDALSEALQSSFNLYEIETLKYIEADIIYRNVTPYRISYGTWEPFRETRGIKTINGFKSSKGVLFEERENRHGTDFISNRMLQTPEDIHFFLDLIRQMRVNSYECEFTEFDQYIGEDGIATLAGPITPIQEMLQFKMGVQQTTCALMDQPNLMEKLFEAIHALNIEIYSLLAQSQAEVTISYEETSTTIMSHTWYDKYCAEQLNEYGSILHKNGKYFIVNMFGKIKKLMEQIAQGNMDGLDSVCPPPSGDIEPADAINSMGKFIIGGLDPVQLCRMDEEKAAEYAQEIMEQVKDLGPFILSTCASTAAGTPLNNLKSISQVVKNR